MNKKFRRKKGLFLTVELLAVIIIIIFLTSIAALSGSWLLASKEVAAIGNEVGTLKEQTIVFKGIFGAWPGQIALENLSESKNSQLNQTYVQTRTGYVTSTLATHYWKPQSKMVASAAQLYASGLIPQKHMTTSTTCSQYDNFYSSSSGCHLKALFNGRYTWIFNTSLSQITGTDYGNGAINNGFYGAALTNSALTTYLDPIRSNPSFTLIDTRSIRARGTPDGLYFSGTLQSSMLYGMEINKAEKVGTKLGGKMPNSNESFVFAEDVNSDLSASSTDTSKTYLRGSFSCTTKTDYSVSSLQNAYYKQRSDSTYGALPNGCILVFRVI